jgi:hypothetical protein
MADAFGRIAAAYAICGLQIAEVDLLPPRNPNHVRFRLTFTDGSRLHISEEWRSGVLGAYSYYWLDVRDALIQGWDNAPHHPHLAGFPHHTHVGAQYDRQPTDVSTLEEVLVLIRSRLSAT